MRLWGLGSLKFIERSGRLEIQVGIGIAACCLKSARAGQDMHAGCCSLEAELLSSSGNLYLCFLRPLTDWMRLTHIMEVNLHHLNIDLNITHC